MSLVHRDSFGTIYIETAFTCEMKNAQTSVNEFELQSYGTWLSFIPVSY